MPTWSSIQTEVYTLTNRPDLAAETLAAVRSAVRTAHTSAKYWKDLVAAPLVGIATSTPVQSIPLSALTRPRAIASIQVTGQDIYLDPVTIDDLVDADGFVRTNKYWGLGAELKLRAENPVSAYTVCYYQWPFTDASNVTSWIVDDYRDLILFWAASTVLGMVGETEIRGRMDSLAAIAFADLQQDNIEVAGR